VTITSEPMRDEVFSEETQQLLNRDLSQQLMPRQASSFPHYNPSILKSPELSLRRRRQSQSLGASDRRTTQDRTTKTTAPTAPSLLASLLLLLFDFPWTGAREGGRRRSTIEMPAACRLRSFTRKSDSVQRAPSSLCMANLIF